MLDIGSIYFGGIGDVVLNHLTCKNDKICSLLIVEKAVKT